MKDNMVVVTTLPVNNTASHLPIVLELTSTDRINTNRTFEYRHNPNFTDISPRNHLTVYVPFNTATRLRLLLCMCVQACMHCVQTYIPLLLFTARRNARIASAVLATAIPSVCPSVRPSVCLPHAGIVSKRLHVARCSLHCQIAKCVLFCRNQTNVSQGRPLPPEILARTDLPPPDSSES